MATHPINDLFDLVLGDPTVRCQERSHPRPCLRAATTIIAQSLAVCDRCAASYHDHGGMWQKHPIERATPSELVAILRLEQSAPRAANQDARRHWHCDVPGS